MTNAGGDETKSALNFVIDPLFFLSAILQRCIRGTPVLDRLGRTLAHVRKGVIEHAPMPLHPLASPAQPLRRPVAGREGLFPTAGVAQQWIRQLRRKLPELLEPIEPPL